MMTMRRTCAYSLNTQDRAAIVFTRPCTTQRTRVSQSISRQRGREGGREAHHVGDTEASIVVGGSVADVRISSADQKK